MSDTATVRIKHGNLEFVYEFEVLEQVQRDNEIAQKVYAPGEAVPPWDEKEPTGRVTLSLTGRLKKLKP